MSSLTSSRHTFLLLVPRIPGHHPPPGQFGVSLLAALRRRDPIVLLLHDLRARHPARRADLQLPSALTGQRRILRQHMQIPQRQASRQPFLRFQLNGGSQLEEAEIGNSFRAGTHTYEFDFRHDEAIATAVFAHAAMEMRQRGEIEYLSVTNLAAHSRVPAVK